MQKRISPICFVSVLMFINKRYFRSVHGFTFSFGLAFVKCTAKLYPCVSLLHRTEFPLALKSTENLVQQHIVNVNATA